MTTKVWTADEVRNRFANFMEENGHTRIDGVSIISQDPTLLFVAAGMVPLKPYLSGEVTPPAPNLYNLQQSVRTPDLADVGDFHHLTLFEMMGNWSIGEYGREEAIFLAYKFLIQELELDIEKIYVTYFSGDEARGIPSDEVAHNRWLELGFPESRIVPLGIEDNFWGPVGPTGPCGPCSEVFYDTGQAVSSYEETGEFDTEQRYVEIWNPCVYMQYIMQPDGTLLPLNVLSIDAGSGLERLVMNLNKMDSVYETDRLAPAVALAAVALEADPKSIYVRKVADHIRTATAILNEGIFPGNKAQSYVLRQLIRNAYVAAFKSNHMTADTFETLVPDLIRTYMDVQADYFGATDIVKVSQHIAREAYRVERNIRNGVKQLNKTVGPDTLEIPAGVVAHLHTTFGVPYDLLDTIRPGATTDEAALAKALDLHSEISRGNTEAKDGSITQLTSKSTGYAIAAPTGPAPTVSSSALSIEFPQPK